MRVAYQGEPGAFSQEACIRFAPEAQPVACPSFEAVIAAVRTGACERAMMPIANTVAGPVEAAVRLLAGAGLTEVGRFGLPVVMMLIGAPGATVAGLKTVSSHPVALKQCRQLIAELQLTEEPAFDTAGAARLLAEAPDPTRAVLASRAAAERYGLPLLRADVQDRADNVTTFLLLKA